MAGTLFKYFALYNQNFSIFTIRFLDVSLLGGGTYLAT